MSNLTIEEILAANDRKVEPIEVPEWGGTVYVRRWSAAESIAFSAQLRVIGSEDSAATERLSLTLQALLCDEDGASICTMEQAKKLADKSASIVNLIVERGNSINALNDKAVENAAKN